MCPNRVPLFTSGLFVKFNYLLSGNTKLFNETLYLNSVLILFNDTFEGLTLAVLDPLHVSEFFF